MLKNKKPFLSLFFCFSLVLQLSAQAPYASNISFNTYTSYGFNQNIRPTLAQKTFSKEPKPGGVLVGLGYGPRMYSNIPDSCGLKNADSNGKVVYNQLHFKQKSAKSLSFYMTGVPEDKGMTFQASIDAFGGSTPGFGVNIQPGYKFNHDKKLSIMGMFGIDFSVNALKVDFLKMEPYHIYSADELDPGNKSEVILLGSKVVTSVNSNGDTINYGSNYMALHASAVNWGFKPSINISYKIGKSVAVFADLGYDIIFGKRKLGLAYSAKGYASAEAMKDSLFKSPPTYPSIVSIDVKKTPDDYIKTTEGDFTSKIPINYNGLRLSIGIAKFFDTGSASGKK